MNIFLLFIYSLILSSDESASHTFPKPYNEDSDSESYEGFIDYSNNGKYSYTYRNDAGINPVSPVSGRASSASTHRNTTHVSIAPSSVQQRSGATGSTVTTTPTPTHHSTNKGGESAITSATLMLGSLTSAKDDTTSLVTIQNCTSDQFRCMNGICVHKNLLCNRQVDCSFGEDENSCIIPCEISEYRCNNGKCISKSYLCDGKSDCSAGEDEISCIPSCTDDQFKCSDGKCISKEFICNGQKDCISGKDEQHCLPLCIADQVRCKDGKCIDKNRVCDGQPDCDSEEDELECVQVW